MIIENLNPQDTKDLNEFLTDMQRANPQLKWGIFPMGNPNVSPHPIHHVDKTPEEVYASTLYRDPMKEMVDELKALREQITIFQNKIEMIFGDHVLVNGRFVKLNNPPKV